MINHRLSEGWGQQVLIDNRAGGGTVIGSDVVAKSTPEGHTLLLTANPHTTNPALHPKLPYDTVRDFAGITQIAASPLVLTVHPSVPARSVRELIALAKQRPGQQSYGTSGNGGPQHLAGEMFKIMAGVAIIHVPYRGGAPAIADLMAGQTQLMFGSTFTVIPQNAAGRLRALAVTSAQRSPALPSLPSIA
jgi:tripartite-type tricarboxylate transporter receptor subunit TctC